MIWDGIYWGRREGFVTNSCVTDFGISAIRPRKRFAREFGKDIGNLKGMA
jgi:hypothetical protein